MIKSPRNIQSIPSKHVSTKLYMNRITDLVDLSLQKICFLILICPVTSGSFLNSILHGKKNPYGFILIVSIKVFPEAFKGQ